MLRVLLVDTDQNSLEVIRRTCLERGDALRTRATADEAQAALDQDDYDLLVLDWNAPQHRELFDGLAAHPRRADIYVLLLTETEALPDEDKSPVEGADDYVLKPLNPEQLKQRFSVANRAAVRRAEHQRVCESYRETAEQLSLAATGTHDGFWYVTVRSEDWFHPSAPIWYSPQMKSLMGFADHELDNVLASWSERLHPDDAAQVFQALDDHLTRRVPYDIKYRLRIRSGEYRWFRGRGQALWNEAGRATRFAGSVRDVTDQHLFDEALRESESRHRLIAETVNDIIWEARLPKLALDDAMNGGDSFGDLALSYVSPAIERVLGYTPTEACQIPLRQWISQPSFDLAMTTLWEELKQESQDPQPARQRTLELEHVTKTGALRYCEVTSVFLRNPAGQPIGILGVSRDITERKQAEATLLRERVLLQQLVEIHERERQLFAYEIHDGLVQHLAASLMHLEVFNESKDVPSDLLWHELARGLKLLRSAVGEGRRLISGLRPPILDEYGIVAAIDYLIHENREALPEVEFVHETHFVRLPPSLENAVFRIVQEALANIRRHSGCQRAQVQLLQQADHLHVEVTDWGIGFHPEQVTSDRFGLQGIRERARLLGGHATIQSTPGSGTRVIVEFPLSR